MHFDESCRSTILVADKNSAANSKSRLDHEIWRSRRKATLKACSASCLKTRLTWRHSIHKENASSIWHRTNVQSSKGRCGRSCVGPLPCVRFFPSDLIERRACLCVNEGFLWCHSCLDGNEMVHKCEHVNLNCESSASSKRQFSNVGWFRAFTVVAFAHVDHFAPIMGRAFCLRSTTTSLALIPCLSHFSIASISRQRDSQ